MNCEGAREKLATVISNQTNGTNFADIIPYELNPEEVDVNITEAPIALTIKDLMLNNVAKSNLILTNLDGSIKVKSFCPNHTLNITMTKTEVKPTTATTTETINQTITESSEVIRVLPTTVIEKVT